MFLVKQNKLIFKINKFCHDINKSLTVEHYILYCDKYRYKKNNDFLGTMERPKIEIKIFKILWYVENVLSN